MKLTAECFDKVKKDCLKFIKSQETKADKFKNKERMLKKFLIPFCFWIVSKVNKKNLGGNAAKVCLNLIKKLNEK